MNDFMTTINIKLNDECLMLLLRGGTVNHCVDQVCIRIQQEKPLVVIEKEYYVDLKRHIYSPAILEHIFGMIDK
ncbi:TPA: hypothetical protein JAG59_002005 [Legionella pneumophila]|nr:hypothetical protein [Legionella pneumophila]HAT5918699.1 hypothetical protein [Legionella pneumophila]HAT5922944.1 hypothetical protein [Legionella pneumophila]HAT5934470.1 hypothetical protein [Legionella pneumophila]HAT5950222.1 hypothetical protein [Legionella pneumophila]